MLDDSDQREDSLDTEEDPGRPGHLLSNGLSHDEQSGDQKHSIRGFQNKADNDACNSKLLRWIEQSLLKDEDLVQQSDELDQDINTSEASTEFSSFQIVKLLGDFLFRWLLNQ